MLGKLEHLWSTPRVVITLANPLDEPVAQPWQNRHLLVVWLCVGWGFRVSQRRVPFAGGGGGGINKDFSIRGSMLGPGETTIVLFVFYPCQGFLIVLACKMKDARSRSCWVGVSYHHLSAPRHGTVMISI